MFLISLVKLRRNPTKEDVAAMDKAMKEPSIQGLKIHSLHWTLGRYDLVIYSEAPNEKVALAAAFQLGEAASTETLVAIPREEALKTVGLR